MSCAPGQKPLKSLSYACVRDVRVRASVEFGCVSRDHHLLAPPLLFGEEGDKERRDGSRVQQENPCGTKRSGESPSPRGMSFLPCCRLMIGHGHEAISSDLLAAGGGGEVGSVGHRGRREGKLTRGEFPSLREGR
jgi:hypothetical protein